MSVYVHKAGLSYLSVPKCAGSSLKRFCFEVEHGGSFDDLAGPMGLGRLHQTFVSQRFARFLNRMNAGEFGGELITVIRNPVDRLASCYTSKVLRAQALDKLAHSDLDAAGLPRAPDFATFVRHLDDYRRLSKVIERHSRPLSYFLGTDPARFAVIFDITQIAAFADLLNTRAGSHATLHHLHATRPDHPVHVSATTAADINDYMAEDIALFGPYMTPSNRITT